MHFYVTIELAATISSSIFTTILLKGFFVANNFNKKARKKASKTAHFFLSPSTEFKIFTENFTEEEFKAVFTLIFGRIRVIGTRC